MVIFCPWWMEDCFFWSELCKSLSIALVPKKEPEILQCALGTEICCKVGELDWLS